MSLFWRACRARHRDQKAELEAIRRVVRSTDVICDIGANKGSYLYWLARWAHRGHVYAFEPQASLAAYLARAFRDFSNVTVEACGVDATTGEKTLYADREGSPGASLYARSGAIQSTIKTVSLDDYFQVRPLPSLIKVDAEGAELAIFQGAARVLAEARPALLFECEQRHLAQHSIFDVFRFLEQFGYRGNFFAGRTVQPLLAFEPAKHQRQAAGAWREPDYCNNFLFYA